MLDKRFQTGTGRFYRKNQELNPNMIDAGYGVLTKAEARKRRLGLNAQKHAVLYLRLSHAEFKNMSALAYDLGLSKSDLARFALASCAERLAQARKAEGLYETRRMVRQRRQELKLI